QAAAGVAGDASVEALIATGSRGQALRAEALILRLVAHDRIFDVIADAAEMLGLVMMRVDIDDEKILIAALLCLLRRMREEGLGVEFLDREIAEIERVHRQPRTI